MKKKLFVLAISILFGFTACTSLGYYDGYHEMKDFNPLYYLDPVETGDSFSYVQNGQKIIYMKLSETSIVGGCYGGNFDDYVYLDLMILNSSDKPLRFMDSDITAYYGDYEVDDWKSLGSWSARAFFAGYVERVECSDFFPQYEQYDELERMRMNLLYSNDISPFSEDDTAWLENPEEAVNAPYIEGIVAFPLYEADYRIDITNTEGEVHSMYFLYHPY